MYIVILQYIYGVLHNSHDIITNLSIAYIYIRYIQISFVINHLSSLSIIAAIINNSHSHKEYVRSISPQIPLIRNPFSFLLLPPSRWGNFYLKPSNQDVTVNETKQNRRQ